MARARKSSGSDEMKAVAAYAGHRLRELRRPDESVSYQGVADLVGIGKPQVFDLINFGRGYGPKVERALADHFFAGSVDKLLFEAGKWWASQPKAAEQPVVVEDPRYEALEAVRAMARAEKYPAAFVKKFEAQLDADDQPSAGELWDLMRAAWASHQRKIAAAGDPLEGLDEPVPQNTRKKR